METNEQTNPNEATQTPINPVVDVAWLDEELGKLNEAPSFDGPKLPALQFEENKISEFDIDFSEPFKKWDDEVNGVTKAIIPCRRGSVDCLWWLNLKNPIYKDVIRKGREGCTHFKVLQTGNKKSTKYNLVED